MPSLPPNHGRTPLAVRENEPRLHGQKQRRYAPSSVVLDRRDRGRRANVGSDDEELDGKLEPYPVIVEGILAWIGVLNSAIISVQRKRR